MISYDADLANFRKLINAHRNGKIVFDRPMRVRMTERKEHNPSNYVCPLTVVDEQGEQILPSPGGYYVIEGLKDERVGHLYISSFRKLSFYTCEFMLIVHDPRKETATFSGVMREIDVLDSEKRHYAPELTYAEIATQQVAVAASYAIDTALSGIDGLFNDTKKQLKARL